MAVSTSPAVEGVPRSRGRSSRDAARLHIAPVRREDRIGLGSKGHAEDDGSRCGDCAMPSHRAAIPMIPRARRAIDEATANPIGSRAAGSIVRAFSTSMAFLTLILASQVSQT